MMTRGLFVFVIFFLFIFFTLLGLETVKKTARMYESTSSQVMYVCLFSGGSRISPRWVRQPGLGQRTHPLPSACPVHAGPVHGYCCGRYASYWNAFLFFVIQGGHGTGKTGKTGNLVLTFSRQGKHREFCFDTGKNFETQGKYFSATQGKI